MEEIFKPIVIVTLLVTVVGSATDLKTKLIPNWLTFSAAAVGIIWNGIVGGWQGAGTAALAWILAVAIMVGPQLIILPQKKDKMGGGDTKLIAAIGALLGPALMLLTFLYFNIINMIYCLIRLLPAVPWSELGAMIATAQAGNEPRMSDEAGLKLKEVLQSKNVHGPMIAAGTLIAVLLQKQTLHFLGFG